MREVPNTWVVRTPTRTWTEGARPQHAHWLAMLVFLMGSEFRSRYRAQALGVVWSLLNPIVTMAALTMILGPTFGHARGHYSMFLLVGLVFWSFVSGSTNAAIGSLVAKGEILKRSPVLRQIVPISVMLSYLTNLGIETVALLAFSAILAGGVQLSAAMVVIPAMLCLLMALLAGVALAGATLNALYRDVAYLTSTALTFLFWLTPIVYPLETVSEPYRTMLSLNPLTAILESIRGALMAGAFPGAQMWLVAVSWSLGTLGIGLVVFKRLEAAMLDHV